MESGQWSHKTHPKSVYRTESACAEARALWIQQIGTRGGKLLLGSARKYP